MNSRIDKYYDEVNSSNSRLCRNKELYQEINKTELDNYEIKSNATVIGDNSKNIDIAKIQNIISNLDDVPKRKSIRIDEPLVEPQNPIIETKEYDINVILDKAKESKVETYEEKRAKKLRDTQFDILSNLEVPDEPEEEIDNHKKEVENELKELINTITINENEVKKKQNENTSKELDIFEDLKGGENTVTLDGLQEKTEELMKKVQETSSLDSSFFTKNTKFKKEDFEDFSDINEQGSGIFIKLVILLLVIVFIVGVIILVKSFL